MVGSTLVSTGDRIQNDNYLKVGVLGAYNLPLVEWTREVVTDTPAPGMCGMPATGAGGEDKRQLCDDKDPRGDCFFEIDFAQISTCASTSTYTAADEAPIIPFLMNKGAICRNIHMIDPAANVNANTLLCTSSGTQGYLKTVTEMTFETGSATGGYQYQTNTWGTNAAAGTYGLDFFRTKALQLYYLADPNANYQDVVAIL